MTLRSLNCVDAKKFRFVPRVKIDGVFRREMADSIEFMRFQDIGCFSKKTMTHRSGLSLLGN